MNITSKKYADGWRATAFHNGQEICAVFGYNTKARAERAASESARDELRRNARPLASQLFQQARLALV